MGCGLLLWRKKIHYVYMFLKNKICSRKFRSRKIQRSNSFSISYYRYLWAGIAQSLQRGAGRLDRLWGPPSPISNGYRGVKRPGVKLATHLHLVPRSRMVELYLHFPMSSWHSALLLKHKDNFTFSPYILSVRIEELCNLYGSPTFSFLFYFIFIVRVGETWAVNGSLYQNRMKKWSISWNQNWQDSPKYLEKTCPSATLSTKNPTLTKLGLNPYRRSGKLPWATVAWFEVP
jgi:hypothetical protein